MEQPLWYSSGISLLGRLKLEATLIEVERFWNENPLFTGESAYDEHFFEHHREIYFSEVFFGIKPQQWFAFPKNKAARILDLGCGIGFWCEYLLSLGYERITGADLSTRSLELARDRVKANSRVQFQQENAEKLTFADGQFDHVNCQGVVHHTPNTQGALNEIARVLPVGGTASISVYYSNWLVKLYPMLRSTFSGVSAFWCRYWPWPEFFCTQEPRRIGAVV